MAKGAKKGGKSRTVFLAVNLAAETIRIPGHFALNVQKPTAWKTKSSQKNVALKKVART
jgi:uncharacterized Rossmann fold enzyme